MKLKKLVIERNWYSWDNVLQPLKGSLEVVSDPKDNNKTSLSIELNDDEIQKILEVVSESVVIAAKRHSQIILNEVKENIEATQ